MTSSIKSQSMARRSSYGDNDVSWGIVKVSACQRGSPNGATGVLSSLGGPGGTGRVGSGRTRGWTGEEMVPSFRVKGELGGNCVRGDSEASRSWGGEGSMTLGRVGRATMPAVNDDSVSGGDHAGGGVLGRN